MKTISFVLLGLMMAISCAAQTAEPLSVGDFHSEYSTSFANNSAFNQIESRSFNYKTTKEWKRYKVLRAVGWSALGVGIPATLFGLVGVGVSALDGDPYGGFIAILATGGALTLSSIPILISAYHYCSKAKKVALELRMSQVYTPGINNRQSFQPVLGISLRF